MNLNEAIEILRIHNIWRRGGEMPQQEASVLGEAIDTVCTETAPLKSEIARLKEQLAECRKKSIHGGLGL